ncbi:TPA: hypothetical protein ACTR19_000710 [Yersinia enterocolitica]|uniref:hypothetical protein n=1 Tax=Yersinia enterocolitica TaxID=630 RepID=UPI001C207F39|nr:hypothetical protein [Yersinia enterocolitica]EKN3560075.1 hypothetical protein [Yersinia enterocolitica]MBX9482314.1 hypothetical protein [Yersinia enterocolitica]NQS92970.1 hypothetical protein [Yersinia enterocolitica]NQT41692.1 hypothetical protein [Yersinia enterocolitica]NQU00619.1 hypothetical protein [Yersinia enterocolitica]
MIEENKPLPAQYLNVVSVSNSTNISEKPELSSEKPIITPLFEDKKNTIEKARDEINKLCDTQECDLDELKNARVKLARKQFFINVIESIVSLSSFVVSVGLSIFSGGVATPVAILTGLNLMLSLSNLACAYHNWNCASKNKEELTMGCDAMQQAVFILAKYCQASPMNAKKIARFTSYFIKAGIVVSLGVVALSVNPVINNSLCLLAKNSAPILTSMMSAATAGALGAWMNHDSDVKEAIVEKLVIIEKEIIKLLAILEGRMKELEELTKLCNKNQRHIVNET